MWIAQAHRELSAEVPAPPTDVRGFYVDLRNMALVHPLVVSVRCTEHRTDQTGEYRDYRVRDRIPVGPLAMSVVYHAEVLVTPDGLVRTEARQFPHVRLSGTVAFDATSTGTLITERIDISAPRPLAAFTVSRAVQAHTSMLARIAGYFEQGQA